MDQTEQSSEMRDGCCPRHGTDPSDREGVHRHQVSVVGVSTIQLANNPSLQDLPLRWAEKKTFRKTEPWVDPVKKAHTFVVRGIFSKWTPQPELLVNEHTRHTPPSPPSCAWWGEAMGRKSIFRSQTVPLKTSHFFYSALVGQRFLKDRHQATNRMHRNSVSFLFRAIFRLNVTLKYVSTCVPTVPMVCSEKSIGKLVQSKKTEQHTCDW